MSQMEPMDVDGINNDFDNKENSLRHSNISRTPCMEKRYEELDVSELNMKLRYSITPASSPLSKSLTSHCLDNRSINNDDSMNSVVISENNNLTRSLNSTITRNDTKRSQKSLPLQALSNGTTGENRVTLDLCTFNSKSEDANVTTILNGIIDNDEHISLPSTPLPVVQMPEEATALTKEVPKHDGGSPILRGLKSVLNMFRSSQSPITDPDNKIILGPELISPSNPKKMVDTETSSILASTPIVTKHKENCGSKRSSPLKESITFNDDLEKELQWKDDTTILFKEEKIPIHKLFPAQLLPSNTNIADCVMVDSITEQNANVNTSLEYMDISNNDSVLLNKVVTNATSELQETPTVESDGEFEDCETTVNDDIKANNREDRSYNSNVTVQCNKIEPDNTPENHKVPMNNSLTITGPTPFLEDNFIMKNSNLSELVQQATDVCNELVEIIANDCNVLERCVQNDINGVTVDKNEKLESEKNDSGLPQNSNELLALADIESQSDKEKQNICDNKQFNELIIDGLDFVTPIINTTLPKDGFQICDNVNKHCDELITPSDVPLPDEDEVENEINSEKLAVSMFISETTAESINEKEGILDIDQSKLVPCGSHSKFSNNEKDTSLQEVISENPIILQQQSYLICNLSIDNANKVPGHHQISSKLTDLEQKMSVDSNMIDSREKENETPSKNVKDINLTTNQSESLIESVSNYTERIVSDYSNVLLDKSVCQALIKTINPCLQNNREQILDSSLNLTETPKTLVNVQEPEEIMTIVSNTIEDLNLKILSKDINEISEQVNTSERTFDMSLNLNNEQDSISFIKKPANLIIASEHIPKVINEEPHNFQQYHSSKFTQDEHDPFKSDESLEKNKTESVCENNHLISSMTMSDVITQSVLINNEENCILSNNKPDGKEIENALHNSEELTNLSVKEQTNEINDKVKVLEDTYTKQNVYNGIHVDNTINKEVIKEDLTIVNEYTINNMNISSSLSPKNISTEYDFSKIDDLSFMNSKIQNLDFPDNKAHAENPISNNCIEENNLIANNETVQEADKVKFLNTTRAMEEVPVCTSVNNNIDQEETKIENVHKSINMSPKLVSPPPTPKIISIAHNHLEDVDSLFTVKPKMQSGDFTVKVGFVADMNTNLHNCEEQLNLNVNEPELISNAKSLETTYSEKDMLSIALTDSKINTEKREEDHVDEVITKESIESPPLSPEISCKGYNFNFEYLEDPFATKTTIGMSPPLGYTATLLPTKEENSKNSDPLNQYEGFQAQKLYPEHKQQENSVTKLISSLGSLNSRCSKAKNQEITWSEGEASSNVNDHIESPVDVNFGKVVDNNTLIRNEEVSDCQTEIKLNKENDMSVEKKVNEKNSKTRRETLLNEDKKASFSLQSTSNIANLQTKNVFNLPEMSGVFISKSSACVSHPLALENVQAESDINVYNNRPEENRDKNMEVDNVSFIASSSSKTMQDAVVDDVNTEDDDTIEGPFFESEEFSKVDKTTDQNDMINFTDTSFGGIKDNVDNGEMFIDAEAFDFLLNQNKSNVVADSGKESLFLKFDPLFAKRMSSDGVLSASNEVKKRPSTPKKILRASTRDVTCDKISSGPSNSNITTEIHNTLESSFEDPNFALSKPMMVVNPAFNARPSQRNRCCTPPRANRGSLTFASPAIAVIDRLLSLSGNNSPLDRESTNTYVRREPNEADLALSQLRELLAEKEVHVQNLRSESKELRNRLSTLESQVKKVESESEQKLRNINELNESLAEKTKLNKSMTVVLEEYERTMASLIAEIEQDKKRHAEERARLKNERNEQTAHLASMELAFNDLHSKYEKSKQIIMGCKANEEAYRSSLEEFQENLLKMQKNYELLKQHATSQLNHANREFDRLKRAHEAEILKLNAMVKRKEVDICSLEETLAQKIKTNEELAAICDDLINKVG